MRLMLELKEHLGPTFARSTEDGFSRSAAVTALRALIGNSTRSDVDRGAGFRGRWSAAIRGRIADVLLDIASRTPINNEMVLQVLSPQSLSRERWLTDVRSTLATGEDGADNLPDVRVLPVFGPEPSPLRDTQPAGFVNADQFEGQRRGYVFRAGTAGLGYYECGATQ